MQCPGQDTRYWKPGDIFEIPCPRCGQKVEFFKDDASRKCKNCGHVLLNPKIDFGCAAYCKYAEQCLGNLPPELIAQKKDLLKNRVAIEMKRYFNRDYKRIGHASKVARYAEKIALNERADVAVLLITAYLHDIGIKEAEGIHHSNDPCYHEELGQPIARKILEGLHADKKLIDEVCDIISHHHHPRPNESLNFMALYDADMLVRLEEEHKDAYSDREMTDKLIDESFFTETAKKLARDILS